MSYTLDQSLTIPDGRITLFEDPDPEKTYSLGLDFALGLEDGDFDAGVMLDQYGDQIATVHGHWGESFAEILWPLIDWFQPFIVGERQGGGTSCLRNLYDRWAWLYFDRKDDSRGRRRRDILGHHASETDGLLRRLQKAIAPKDANGHLLEPAICIRDAELLHQLQRFSWNPKRKNIEGDPRDEDVKAGAPSGEHDDLVSALKYAVAGQFWLPEFEKPAPKYEVNTYGAMLGFDETPKKANRSALTS